MIKASLIFSLLLATVSVRAQADARQLILEAGTSNVAGIPLPPPPPGYHGDPSSLCNDYAVRVYDNGSVMSVRCNQEKQIAVLSPAVMVKIQAALTNLPSPLGEVGQENAPTCSDAPFYSLKALQNNAMALIGEVYCTHSYPKNANDSVYKLDSLLESLLALGSQNILN